MNKQQRTKRGKMKQNPKIFNQVQIFYPIMWNCGIVKINTRHVNTFVNMKNWLITARNLNETFYSN